MLCDRYMSTCFVVSPPEEIQYVIDSEIRIPGHVALITPGVTVNLN